MSGRLDDATVDERLRELREWKRDGDAITKTFRFPTFPDAVAFVDRLAEAAEAANHHPDIWIRFRRVTLTYSTHSEGGLTEKDLAGARDADRLSAP
jgi:4a-hydroxytetrahydrobiopterin dehydratase